MSFKNVLNSARMFTNSKNVGNAENAINERNVCLAACIKISKFIYLFYYVAVVCVMNY